MTFSSQPKAVQAVTFDEAALEQYFDAIEELDAAVRTLHKALAEFDPLVPRPEQAHPADGVRYEHQGSGAVHR